MNKILGQYFLKEQDVIWTNPKQKEVTVEWVNWKLLIACRSVISNGKNQATKQQVL